MSIEAESCRIQLSQKIKYAIAARGCCISLGTWRESRTKTRLIAARFHNINEDVVSEDLLFVEEFDPVVYRDGTKPLKQLFFWRLPLVQNLVCFFLGMAIKSLIAEKLAEFSVTEIDCKGVIVVTNSTEKMKAAFEDFDRITCAASLIDICLKKIVNRGKELLRMPEEALPVWKLFQDCKILVQHCKQVS